MRYDIDLPDYEPGHGLRLRWDAGAEIAATLDEEFVIRANPEGLRSLAYHLLALAQPGVPAGTHVHLDEWSGLVEGSAGIVVERSS